jgi:protein TonB
MAQPVLPRHEQHWIAALALAVLAHLVVLYVGFAAPPLQLPLRGGGLFEQGGLSPHSTGGIMVDLSPPAATPAPEARAVPEPEAQPPEEREAERAVQPLEPVAPDQAEPAEQSEPEETVAAEAGSEAVPSREGEAAKPEPKPALPLRRVQLAEREPQPEAQPESAPAPSAQPMAQPETKIANALNVPPSRLGTAGGRSDGVAPTELSYRDRVLLWLKRHIYYPTEAYQFRQEGTVLLRFAINRRGQILYYTIDKSSGYYLLDQAVRIMMAQSSPVPPFPAGQSGEEMRFLVPVIFSRQLSQ